MAETSAPITRIRLKRFTAFESLDLSPSPGLNVFLGTNGTGKTHLMKVAYAACDSTQPSVRFPEKLARVFLPSKGEMGRLVKRRRGRNSALAEVWCHGKSIRASFSSLVKSPASVEERRRIRDEPVSSVYIPVTEMLANAPGLRSLYFMTQYSFRGDICGHPRSGFSSAIAWCPGDSAPRASQEAARPFWKAM